MGFGLNLQTDLGTCRLEWTARGIRAFFPLAPGDREDDLPTRDVPEWVARAAQAIAAHLAGGRGDLEAIPLDLEGVSPFALRVYEALRTVGPGRTVTYGTLALLAGSPGAARAVGRALGANPVMLLVPCHRVVGARGPGGFSAFGGLDLKARLLALEAL